MNREEMKNITITRNDKKLKGFPGGPSAEESACQCRRRKRCRFNSWVGKISWRRKWKPIPVFLKILCTEKPGRLQSMGPKESDTTECLLV